MNKKETTKFIVQLIASIASISNPDCTGRNILYGALALLGLAKRQSRARQAQGP